MNNIMDIVHQWMNLNLTIKKEIESIDSEDELYDCFYQDLSFGTGGMRGEMGVGTNRINELTIKKVSFALSICLLEKNAKPKVAIAYDTRHQSFEFAENTAEILSSQGIESYIFNEAIPTPILSYAVREFGCDAGIVISASHNPKEYNGFKVYNSRGGQLVPSEAAEVTEAFNKVTNFKHLISLDRKNELIHHVDSREVINSFNETIPKYYTEQNDLKITFSPLHGTGYQAIKQILSEFDLSIVKEQALPDGDFPTVESPNPENPDALKMVIEQGKSNDSDIAIATDPDCDRIGVAVKHQGQFEILTGNQLGALFIDYLTFNTNVKDKLIIKTIVTNDLGQVIAQSRGATVLNTLTGFKYICEIINMLEDENQLDRFLLGYEESYGYLHGTYTRDKDGVGAAWLVSEMAQFHKQNNKTLMDRLFELYEEYSYFLDKQESFTYKGKNGKEQINQIMSTARQLETDISKKVIKVHDYSNSIDGLPKSNVLKFVLEDESWFAMRPSGTEPKIKIYYSIRATDKINAQNKLNKLKVEIEEKLNIIMPK